MVRKYLVCGDSIVYALATSCGRGKNNTESVLSLLIKAFGNIFSTPNYTPDFLKLLKY